MLLHNRTAIALLTLLLPAALGAQVTLVNVIPQTSSDESHQDAETNVTYDPAHPNTIAVTAFTAMRPTATNAPVFVSLDGGLNWNANEIIPGFAGSWISQYDISIRFAGSSSYFYAGFLQATAAMFNGRHFRLGRTNDPNLNTVVDSFFPRDQPDQPFTAAATVMGWFDPGKDRVYIGTDDFGVATTRSTVDYTLDATVAAPVNNTVRVETTVPGSGRDGHQCRPAIHPDGTVYVAFVRWNTGGGASADVVVVRDDNWGQGTPPFQSLMNGPVVGVSVVSGVPIPGGNLGLQRLGGNLAIAVDPRDSRSVYVSYQDHQGTDTATLHLRHSPDGGATWPGGDLLVVHNAANTAVAVNSHGRIGMLYQQLVTCGMSQCWETHLRRSDNGTMWNDLLLATFTDGNPVRTYDPYLGDYDNLIAEGKDFVGVFSSDNTPDTTHFAAGVQFNRNANWGTHQLLGNDGMTVIPNSIDPFYFRTTELASTSDFYVRDWTDSMSVHDGGSEPSTHADFFSFSDVWNRRTNDPFPMDASDRPQNQRAQPMAMGPNFAFARVSRNAHTTADSVSAHFLYSDGGVGVNFDPAGVTTIPFTTADSAITPGIGQGVMWNLPSGASNHVCLAVEISTVPNDPLIAPSLLHRSPGWPDTDLSVILDNNKAQRNMEVYDGIGSGVPSYAIAHNASLKMRDMVLGVEIPKGFPRPPRIDVVGGKAEHGKPSPIGQTLILPRMLPGENRWVVVDLTFPDKAGEQTPPVAIYEVVGGQRVNGYAIAARTVDAATAVRENLLQQVAVLDRFGAQGKEGDCHKASAATALLLKRWPSSGFDYAAAVAPLVDCAQAFVSASGSDPFGVRNAAAALAGATDDHARIPLHLALLNGLDAFHTMQQKAKGDPGDIVQMMSWQRALYRRPALRKAPSAARVVEESSKFIAEAGRGVPPQQDYERLLHDQFPAFAETVDALGAPATLAQTFDALRASPSDPRALEHAHRDYLIALDMATGGGQ